MNEIDPDTARWLLACEQEIEELRQSNAHLKLIWNWGDVLYGKVGQGYGKRLRG